MPPLRLPHFLVVGAMKCGTTTLRHQLRLHPRIFMPPREIFLFAIDDIEQHPGALIGEDGRFRVHDFDGDREAYLRWYSDCFAGAAPGQILGEGSTTYMPSVKAPPRIAALLPTAKLVFMLRDPVDRAYSHYWHLVRAGGTSDTFESLLRRSPATVLQRSLYASQIRRYLEYFPREQLKFVLFEELIKHAHDVAAEVARFVGADDDLPAIADDGVRNAARMPRSVALQLLRNRVVGPRGARDRFSELGHPVGVAAPRARRQVIDRIFNRINPLRATRPPAMQAGTRAFLTELLRRENRSLEEVTGLDIERHWYKSPAGRG